MYCFSVYDLKELMKMARLFVALSIEMYSKKRHNAQIFGVTVTFYRDS